MTILGQQAMSSVEDRMDIAQIWAAEVSPLDSGVVPLPARSLVSS